MTSDEAARGWAESQNLIAPARSPRPGQITLGSSRSDSKLKLDAGLLAPNKDLISASDASDLLSKQSGSFRSDSKVQKRKKKKKHTDLTFTGLKTRLDNAPSSPSRSPPRSPRAGFVMGKARSELHVVFDFFLFILSQEKIFSIVE